MGLRVRSRAALPMKPAANTPRYWSHDPNWVATQIGSKNAIVASAACVEKNEQVPDAEASADPLAQEVATPASSVAHGGPGVWA
jgi:hypothetical protein